MYTLNRRFNVLETQYTQFQTDFHANLKQLKQTDIPNLFKKN